MTTYTTTIMEAFGKHVQDLRREKGWTVNEMASRAAIVPQYLRDIERGQRDVSSTTVIKIANALEISPRELLGAPGEISPIGEQVARELEEADPRLRDVVLGLLRWVHESGAKHKERQQKERQEERKAIAKAKKALNDSGQKSPSQKRRA